jgi:hypothetical protein
MPIEHFPGLPAGYELRRNFKGRFYVLVEAKVKDRPLILAEFHSRPNLKRCLDEISAWETLRANVRGDNLVDERR